MSSVINNRAEERGISQKTARRVNEYMLVRGYVPSRRARDLRIGNEDGIGILHSGHLAIHLNEAYSRLCDFFAESPRRLELMTIGRQRLTEGIKELLSRSLSFLVWIHTAEGEKEFNDPAIKNYLSHVTPVIYNYHFTSEKEARELLRKGYYLIGADRKSGHLKLARKLRELGHKRILLPDASSRLDSRKEIFESQGLIVYSLPSLYPQDASPEKAGIATARASLPFIRGEQVTAVAYLDDMVAGFALSEFRRKKVRVPGKLTVTGFDGLDIVRAFYPPLTTLRMPVFEMVECVRGIISGKNNKYSNIFGMELLEGESHGRA